MGERVVLCHKDDLAPGQARRFEVGETRVALVRIGDEFYAVGDRCSHEDYSLAEGEVWEDECEIECPRHGSNLRPTHRGVWFAPGHQAGAGVRGGGHR